ncbi:MAG: hypothetical protein ACPG77_04245 [Nannocystaceae bacterium]
MRDPLAPIPSFGGDPGFWRCTRTPGNDYSSARVRENADKMSEQTSSMRTDLQAFDLDPLLRSGRRPPIDRRSRRRSHVIATATGVTPTQAQGIPRPATTRLGSRLLGLRTNHGWALVRPLALIEGGVLLHHVALNDPELSSRERNEGRTLLAHIVRAMTGALKATIHPPGSLLATVGGCLLSERVIADLSAWASHPEAHHSGNRHQVDLLLTQPMVTSPSAQPLRFAGELVPMTDPQPQTVAITLTDGGRTRFLRALKIR